MTSATDTYALLRAFVDELARCGMRAACTAPGSRCAPLVLSLAREPRLHCYSHVDERCAGFFALGLAKASGLPVAVACTSGTAAAELLPAAIEAHEARVPLLLLTADRPPELREVGAGQAIDQLKLYGSAAKWFFDVGTHDAGERSLAWVRTLACRAYATALEDRPGVVHLNFALREPLVPDETLPHDYSGRPDGRPFAARAHARAAPAAGEAADARRAPSQNADAAAALTALVAGAQRGVILAGREERLAQPGERSVAELAAELAARAGWPLLADPLSRAVAQHGLGKMTIHDGEFKKGLSLIEASTRTYPLALAYRNLAVFWNSEGDSAKTERYIQKALALDPEDPYNLIFAAAFMAGTGHGDEALKIARENESLLPASYNLAAVYAQTGQREKALALLRRHFFEYEHYRSVRAKEMMEARVDAVFASLREDPAFVALTSGADGRLPLPGRTMGAGAGANR